MSYTLKVNVKDASDLKNADWIGKSDPYVIVRVVDRDGKNACQPQKTTVKNNDLNPIWNEELVFNGISNPSSCKVLLFIRDSDSVLGLSGSWWDSLNDDEGLGKGEVALENLQNDSSWKDFSLSVGQQKRSRLNVSIYNQGWGIGETGPQSTYQYKTACAGGAMSYTLKVNVEDSYLKNADCKSHPYVIVRVVDRDGKNACQPQKTRVKNNNLNPIWNEELVFNGISNPSSCKVLLFIRDSDSVLGLSGSWWDSLNDDEGLGKGEVALENLRNDSSWKHFSLSVGQQKCSRLNVSIYNQGWGIGETGPQSTYQYKTACAGGASSTGGYGGPLCESPFGSEVQDIANQILKDSEKATDLCYNNFTDPCPELTKAQVAACKGFDYANKTLKCPFGPIPWPAGTPEAGYVPKTNPLTGRWITVTGGDAEFIKKSIATGMLGGAEAAKIQADVDTKKTGGMYLRITQNGDVCTVDASVAKFARAMRTWKSGHYFYEPLVSGGNLFGVWVLPEEYRKIGFFWEMNSGKVFRIQRNAWMQGGYMFMRQSTEAFGRISHVLYVKVSNDPESGSRPRLQSRDFTALAGVYNAPDNLGKHYPCTPIDLDAPAQRDTWMDENIDIVTAQQNAISEKVGGLEKGQLVVGFGWKSQEFTCSHDAVFEALQFKARNPDKFMDVTNVKVVDKPGYLSRKMTIKATGKTVWERIILNPMVGEMVFQPVNPETGRLEHEERVIAIHDEPNHLEFYQRDAADGMRTPWTVPITVVQATATEVIANAMKLDATVENFIALGFHSDPIQEASHDDLWKALVSAAKDPYFMVFAPACSVSVQEGSKYIERTISCVQRIYIREELQEVVFRSVVDGVETEFERAIILRAHPVELELCERRTINGFRVHSKIPKAVALKKFDTIIKQAMRLAEEPPTIIGLGATSAPVHGVAYPSLFAAVDKTIAMPWLIQNVRESDVSGSDCEGYYSRSMKLPHTGEIVREHVKIDEEKGEVVFSKLGPDLRPGSKQRVLAIHKDPLRMEFFERSKNTGARMEWEAPFKVATDVFTKLTDIAKELESKQHDIVGYGMVSHPYSCGKQKLWKAMAAVLRDPTRFGIKVDQVMVSDQPGFLKRSYRIISQNRIKMEHVRVNEAAYELIFKTVKDGRESDVEHVWAVASKPLRCELHSRKSSDQMRVRWELPHEQANEIFDAFLAASSQV